MYHQIQINNSFFISNEIPSFKFKAKNAIFSLTNLYKLKFALGYLT